MIEPEGRIELDLANVARALGDKFRIRVGGKYGIALEGDGGISISITKTGSALVRGASDEACAIKAYEELMALIREGGMGPRGG
jgi:hypothetical protein